MTKSSPILVVNSGSSSLKLSLFSADAQQRLIDAHFSGINSSKATLKITGESRYEQEYTGPIPITEALQRSLEAIKERFDIPPYPLAIGHRVVHGGERYRKSVVIDKTVMAYLQSLSPLAPLHNPQCLEGINACLKIFGDNIVQVAVFDTAFHRTMPWHAAHYGIDQDIANRLGIQRYGFHGISHHYLWNSYQRHCLRAKSNSKAITLHLGNGCSICAIDAGKSIDTSMGFTPTEGLLMATRSGDIDPSVIPYLCDKEKMALTEALGMLNNRSGLLGVSGLTYDMKELLNMEPQHEKARQAIALFCYRALKYVGAYIAALGGIDTIIFAGGIGENAPLIRQRILSPLTWCGAILDDHANNACVGLQPGELRRISLSEALTEVYVIGTDENGFIAHEALAHVNSFQKH